MSVEKINPSTLLDKYILALPGNPVSAVVCLQLFGYPLLMKMMGRTNSTDWIDVVISEDIKLDTRPEFQRGTAIYQNGQWLWTSTGFQRSSCVTSMARANTLVRLPASTPDLPVMRSGSAVKALLLGPNKV